MANSQRRQWETRLLRYVADRLMRELPDRYSGLGEAYEWWSQRSVPSMRPPDHIRHNLVVLDEICEWIERRMIEGDLKRKLISQTTSGEPSEQEGEPDWEQFLDRFFAHDRHQLFPVWHSSNPLPAPNAMDRLVGQAPAWQEALRLIKIAASCDITTLVIGEIGTGKSLVARSIHDAGHRKNLPFVRVDCQTLTPGNLYEQCTPSLTKRGDNPEPWIHGGTLFLDGLSFLSMDAQSALLNLLERYEEKDAPPWKSPRIILSSRIPLDRRVAMGEFRRDLYFRLSIFQIDLPPLRQRREDIERIVHHLIPVISEQLGVVPPKISRAAISRLTQFHWVGNVRELANALTRTIIYSGGRIEGDDIQLEARPTSRWGVEDASVVRAIKKLAVAGLNMNGALPRVLVQFLHGVGQQQFRTLDIVEDLGIAPSTARSYLSKLVAKGYLNKFGENKGTMYQVVPGTLFDKPKSRKGR